MTFIKYLSTKTTEQSKTNKRRSEGMDVKREILFPAEFRKLSPKSTEGVLCEHEKLLFHTKVQPSIVNIIYSPKALRMWLFS